MFPSGFDAALEPLKNGLIDNLILFYDNFLPIYKDCQAMKRAIFTLALCAALAACGGVPLRALPRLAQLSSSLQEANPAEFMVALQVDARMTPPPGAVPMLVLKLTPKVTGAFEPIDKKLPMQLSVISGATLGLDAPPAGRRWLIYSLPPATQAELQRVQATVQQAQAAPGYQRGGRLGIGVEQDSLVTTDPALARTRWDTWLQVKRSEGFFEVWSGTPAELQKLAARHAR